MLVQIGQSLDQPKWRRRMALIEPQRVPITGFGLRRPTHLPQKVPEIGAEIRVVRVRGNALTHELLGTRHIARVFAGQSQEMEG